MGRLYGYTYRSDIRKLKNIGFEFYRHGKGSHEIGYHPRKNRYTTLPNHSGDLPEGTLRAILKQADVTIEDFLGS